METIAHKDGKAIMSVNLLSAITNIATNHIGGLRAFYESRNRANSMGDILDNYIKDVCADTLNENDEQRRLERLEQAFSYLGN